MYGKDLLSIHDLSIQDVNRILEVSEDIKANPDRYSDSLSQKSLAMIFEKPSLRTRVTFESGMTQLGGHAIYLAHGDIQLGKRESVPDVAKNLAKWVDGIIARTFSHKTVVDLAEEADVPVINALSDLSHPCQALADIFTFSEKKDSFKCRKLVYIGDGNNVAHSLLLASAKIGLNITVVTPKGYEPKSEIVDAAKQDAKESGSEICITDSVDDGAKEADALYTDVWASMGQESEKEERIKIFAPYQVNQDVMKLAKPDAVFMHCLPAHRGEEVSADVIDSWQSIVFDQAENRLHVQKAILYLLLSEAP